MPVWARRVGTYSVLHKNNYQMRRILTWLVICQTHGMADAVRHAVDLDEFARPIHLSILTKAEEAEICFVSKQGCIQVI